MKSRIQTFGPGLKTETHSTFLDGEQVDVDEISVDLSVSSGYMRSKISLDNIDTSAALPGQILRFSDNYTMEWVDPATLSIDKELREEYPSLQIAWETMMEAMAEYDLVKKLVKDYGKS